MFCLNSLDSLNIINFSNHLDIFNFAFLLIYLIYCTIADIRTKSISCKISITILFISFIIKLVFFNGLDTFFYVSILGIIPGLFLIIISFISKKAIGLGDGVIIFTIGIYYGFWKTISILLLSLFISSIFSLAILLKTKTSKYSFPFAPFILMGFLLSHLL